MRYWDSSSLVPLIVNEQDSVAARRLLSDDASVITWWGSRIECASAINRLHRDGALSSDQIALVFEDLNLLADGWAEVQPLEGVRRRAMRLLRVHALRAADAMQLAAALVACREQPESLQFISRDQRLGDAARTEGFSVLLPVRHRSSASHSHRSCDRSRSP